MDNSEQYGFEKYEKSVLMRKRLFPAFSRDNMLIWPAWVFDFIIFVQSIRGKFNIEKRNPSWKDMYRQQL